MWPLSSRGGWGDKAIVATNFSCGFPYIYLMTALQLTANGKWSCVYDFFSADSTGRPFQ